MPRAQLVALVTDGCDSPTRRNYSAAVNDFMDWYEAAGHPLLNKATIALTNGTYRRRSAHGRGDHCRRPPELALDCRAQVAG